MKAIRLISIALAAIAGRRTAGEKRRQLPLPLLPGTPVQTIKLDRKVTMSSTKKEKWGEGKKPNFGGTDKLSWFASVSESWVSECKLSTCPSPLSAPQPRVQLSWSWHDHLVWSPKITGAFNHRLWEREQSVRAAIPSVLHPYWHTAKVHTVWFTHYVWAANRNFVDHWCRIAS